jgi:hypothetical protein
MPWRWKWLGDVAKLAHMMMEELIAHAIWHWVMWSSWRRSRHDLAWWTSCKYEGQVGGFEARDHVWRWSLSKTWRRWTDAMVKSKWSQDRWTNMILWWYEVDHIIVDHVGACVASTSEELEWKCARQRYNLGHFISPVKGYVEKCMAGFRIDGRTIKTGKLVCISVI